MLWGRWVKARLTELLGKISSLFLSHIRRSRSRQGPGTRHCQWCRTTELCPPNPGVPQVLMAVSGCLCLFPKYKVHLFLGLLVSQPKQLWGHPSSQLQQITLIWSHDRTLLLGFSTFLSLNSIDEGQKSEMQLSTFMKIHLYLKPLCCQAPKTTVRNRIPWVKHSPAVVKTLVCYQHCFNHEFKAQHHTSSYEVKQFCWQMRH